MRHKTSHTAQTDPRWVVFQHIQTAKDALGIKTRSLTVLRGLLSFISPEQWAAGELYVFPANRTLQDRCDGMEERTLRRHLAHLCDAGVIQRKMSPNRKRYAVRNERGSIILAYGFDLSGLKYHAERIADLAQQAKDAALTLKVRKAVLRDLIWKTGQPHADLLKLLRNKSSLEAIENAIQSFTKTENMSVTDSQNDRHIQDSKQESYEESDEPKTQVAFEQCVKQTPNAISLSPTPVMNWSDLHDLSITLSPALGLTNQCFEDAQQKLGRRGATLAILGLVQAFGRIKSPKSYLKTLCHKAIGQKLNLDRMFHSLTNSGFRPETT